MMELTPDEQRLIEKQRAEKALETRPIDEAKVLQCTITTIVELVKLGYQLDPHDGIWNHLRQALGHAGFKT